MKNQEIPKPVLTKRLIMIEVTTTEFDQNKNITTNVDCNQFTNYELIGIFESLSHKLKNTL